MIHQSVGNRTKHHVRCSWNPYNLAYKLSEMLAHRPWMNCNYNCWDGRKQQNKTKRNKNISTTRKFPVVIFPAIIYWGCYSLWITLIHILNWNQFWRSKAKIQSDSTSALHTIWANRNIVIILQECKLMEAKQRESQPLLEPGHFLNSQLSHMMPHKTTQG